MPTLIKDGAIIDNPWHTVQKETELAEALDAVEDHVIVPFSLWQEHKGELGESGKTVGVWLDSDDDPYELAYDVGDLPLIALNFPVFRDGRAFSSAAILRGRLSFKGELRAIGDVLRDQLFYMKRCGINSFELEDGINAEEALASFNDFSENYQSTIETPEPLFQRR